MRHLVVFLTTGLIIAAYRWSAGVLPERYQDPLNAGQGMKGEHQHLPLSRIIPDIDCCTGQINEQERIKP